MRAAAAVFQGGHWLVVVEAEIDTSRTPVLNDLSLLKEIALTE